MPPPRTHLTASPFSPVGFEDIVCRLAGRRAVANTQTAYLGSFLRARSDAAKTIVCEEPYIDRHYMEEHSAYYASSFRAVPNHTARVHLFSSSMSQHQLDALLQQAATGGYDEVQKTLEASYLGFVVVRPIADAPIGRTILRPYADIDERVFTTAHRQKAHLGGIELNVTGVPFQQQEVAVGACATTAIWSALASASRAVGARGPTPFAVTEAATRHLVNDRPVPAEAGLDLQQIVSGIRELGFAPYTMKSSEPEFDIFVRCYLNSGFPVILVVWDGPERHAVTALGFRRGISTLSTSNAERPLISLGMEKVYVHEDRLGPYARMTWTRTPPRGDDRDPRLVHEPYEDARYKYASTEMRVSHAIVPLYPKLRLSARGLLDAAVSMQPWLREQLGAQAELRVELKFVSGADYLTDLMRTEIKPAERAKEIATLALPRWVGVARFLNEREEAVMDVVCDTTDIYRAEPIFGAVLAVVALVPDFVDRLRNFVDGQRLADRVAVI